LEHIGENGFGVWKGCLRNIPLDFNQEQGLRSWDMTLKNLPWQLKHLSFILSKRVDSILNQNTINTIYSIYKKQ
jgi:N-acetylmuramoyl-L-alanine amidase